MADGTGKPAAENAAGTSSNVSASTGAGKSGEAAFGSAPKKPLPEQNPAFRMMGLPRLRLPSRNWMIFLSITGSIAGAVIYDKWQTKKMREKWCKMVAHIADEPLDTKVTPRKVTIYMAAPPGDGLRSAREHFHAYVKPVLVSAAMDWDVVEGRKEGDVRHKTAERIRKLRRKNGEGEPLPKEDDETDTVETIRAKNGDVDFPGVAGDIVIGRHTWKEYVRGLHEGYLGPPDPPKDIELETPEKTTPGMETSIQPSNNDSPVTTLSDIATPPASEAVESDSGTTDATDGSQPHDTAKDKPSQDETKEEEKPKRRFPPSYILPADYESATLSPSTPELLGPSVGVRLPHLLGIRNTPIRLYRFLTRRKLQDDVGRQVAEAILASHRSYGSVAAVDENSTSDALVDVPEQKQVLALEEKDWWKTVRQPRKEHEESVWIEPMVFDERITGRMHSFQLSADDETRSKRIESGTEPIASRDEAP